jgi:enamine deaminase RidA (YjgF/YER057c/UK114 family)
MTRREIQPDSVPQPVAEYAQGVEVSGGRTLYLAGQIALDAEGNLVGDGEFRAQARQVFANVAGDRRGGRRQHLGHREDDDVPDGHVQL